MALFLNVLITPLAESKIMDNQGYIDKANAANAGLLPDDPKMQRVPEYEQNTKLTYLETKEEKIGDTLHVLQSRQDVKYFGDARPKLGVPQIFQAKLVEYQINKGDPVALSYKLMNLVDPKDVGLGK